MKSARLNSGFTFIEIILVLAILGIISIMAPIFYSRFLLRNAVENTTDQLAGFLNKAKIYSMMSKRGDNWSISSTPGGYSVRIVLFKGDLPYVPGEFDEFFDLPPLFELYA